MLMWTSKAVTDKIGLGPAYLSLVMFNAFTTGFTLVTIQTEPAFLACSFGVYNALQRRWYWLAAVLAGAASGLRISGVGTAIACGIALVAHALTSRPGVWRTWVNVGLLLPVCAWGLFAMVLYDSWRFHDPLIYVHSHSQNFDHGVGLRLDTERLIHSLEVPLHSGWLLAIALFIFAIGHRRGLRPFDPVGRVYWYGLFVFGVGVSALGSADIAFAGMNRYLLTGIPLFFVLARLMVRRIVLACLWIACNLWHYWQADLCFSWLAVARSATASATWPTGSTSEAAAMIGGRH
jgi:hypothetical protein